MSDSLRPQELHSVQNSPGQNTGVGSLSLLHGIFPTQGLNPGLPHSRWILYQLNHQGSPNDSLVKNLPPVQETQETHVGFLGQEDPLEEEMEAHSSILAWKIPWTQEHGGLQSMGWQRVGHDWVHTRMLRQSNPQEKLALSGHRIRNGQTNEMKTFKQ